MSSGTVSFRAYYRWDASHGHDTIWAGLPQGTDMRLYDAMPYYADHNGTVTRDNIPPAGVHLSCREVGGLICLWKGGGITKEELGQRWPSSFTADGKVHKVRRPMGEPFLMSNGEDTVFGVAFGHYLLCGSGYKTDAWEKLAGKLQVSRKEYFWYLDNLIGKFLQPSRTPAVAGDIDDDRGVLPALTRSRANKLKEDGRAIWADRSSAETPIKGSWGGSANVKRHWPKPATLGNEPRSNRKYLDEGDRDSDYPKHGREEPFAKLTTSNPVVQPPPRSSNPKAVDRPTVTKPIPASATTAKSLNQATQQRVKPRPGGLIKREASEELEDPRPPPPQPKPFAQDATTSSSHDPYDTNEVRLIRQIQRFDDTAAKSLALITQYRVLDESITASHFDTTKSALDAMIKEDVTGKNPEEVLVSWRDQLRTVKKGLLKFNNIKVDYSNGFEPEIEQMARSLEGVSAYNISQTRTNKVHRPDLITSITDDYPPEAPDQERRKAVFMSKRCPDYDVDEAFKKSQVYLDLINCHFTGWPKTSDKIPNRQLDPTNPNYAGEQPIKTTDDDDFLDSAFLSSTRRSPSARSDTKAGPLNLLRDERRAGFGDRGPSFSSRGLRPTAQRFEGSRRPGGGFAHSYDQSHIRQPRLMYDAPYDYDRYGDYDRYEDYDRPLGLSSGRSYLDRGDPRAGSYVSEIGYGHGRPNRRDDEGRYGGTSDEDLPTDEWGNRRIG